MKYKVVKGTPLFDQLQALAQRCIDANAAADDLAKSLGAEASYSRATKNRAGGVDAFRFDYGKEPDPALWTQPDRHNNKQMFYPRAGKKYAVNQPLHDQIAALPIVSFQEFNEAIGFERQWVGLSLVHCYTLCPGRDVVLIDTGDEADYTPVEGMQEILVSEFRALKKTIEEANKKAA